MTPVKEDEEVDEEDNLSKLSEINRNLVEAGIDSEEDEVLEGLRDEGIREFS